MARGGRRLGTKGERAAESLLRRRRYRILERNYACRYGEADIVADDSGTLVFVEVKTRVTGRYGPPEISVTPRKQRRYSRVALHYMKEHGVSDVPVRFDVVSIIMTDEGKVLQREVIPNAFEGHEE